MWMKKRGWVAVALGAACAASAAALAAQWAFGFRPVNAQMAIYAGGLGDPAMPTGQDAKVTFHVQGKAARELFDHLGPDVKSECSADFGTRVRLKEKLLCVQYSKSDTSCYFGFDLRDGKSIGGSIC